MQMTYPSFHSVPGQIAHCDLRATPSATKRTDRLDQPVAHLGADAFDVIAEGKADRANQLVAERDDEVRFRYRCRFASTTALPTTTVFGRGRLFKAVFMLAYGARRLHRLALPQFLLATECVTDGSYPVLSH